MAFVCSILLPRQILMCSSDGIKIGAVIGSDGGLDLVPKVEG